MGLEIDTLGEGASPARNISVRTDVYYLPEFYSSNQFAGRSDPGTPRRKLGSISDTEDLEGTVRKLATGPGAYFSECRAGREVVESGVFELKPKGQSLVIESPNAAQNAPQVVASQQPTQETSSARSINDTTETIRATKELLKEVTQPQSPSPTKEDLAQMIRQAVSEALAQNENPTPKGQQQPDEMDRLLKTVNGLKALGVIPERKENPAPTSDPTESFLNMYERFIGISERINPNGEARSGWLDKITGVVESVARVASTPAVGAVVMRLMTAPPGTAGTQAAPHPVAPPAPPQPHIASVTEAQTPPPVVEEAEQEETAESAVSAVLTDACHDLLSNADVGEGAKDITRLLEDWPELVSHIEALLALPTPQMQNALALLAGEVGPQIMAAPHAIEWLDKLKTAIALRRGPVLVAPSKNGSGVQAA